MNIHSLTPGRVYTKEWLQTFILNSEFCGTPARLNGIALRRYRHERAKKIDATIQRFVDKGDLAEVDGGYERASLGETMVHFIWENKIVSVPRSEYFEKLAELRAEKLARSPEEQRKKNVELEIAELMTRLQKLETEASTNA